MSKLLFIQYRPIGAIMNGGDQCTKRNYDMLCRVLGNENVDIYYIHQDEKRRSLMSYVRGVVYMPFGYYFGLYPALLREIVNKAMRFDCVFIDRSVYGLIAKTLRQNGYKGQIIVNFHNVESIYFDARLPKSLPFRKVLISCADRNDRFACTYADTIVILNNRDVEALKERYTLPRVVEIPITLNDTFKAIDDKTDHLSVVRQQPLCVFLGSYFQPNNEGILWFVHEVLPHVNIRMQIVGKNMAQLKQEHKELQDIEVISDAPDLTPYLIDADIMILPIFAGSGMKVKTCESLMYGKNIIGTAEAFEGYKLDYERVGGRCATAEEFRQAIHRIVEQSWPRFNDYSRQTYLAHYSPQALELQWKEVVRL